MCVNPGLVVHNLRNWIVLYALCICKLPTACQSHMLFSRAGQSQSDCWVRNPRSWCTCACLWQSLSVPQMMNEQVQGKLKRILTQGITVDDAFGCLSLDFHGIPAATTKPCSPGCSSKSKFSWVHVNAISREFRACHSHSTTLVSENSIVPIYSQRRPIGRNSPAYCSVKLYKFHHFGKMHAEQPICTILRFW